jgi:hypothetical protein
MIKLIQTPVYFLPDHGAPTLGPGEHGVAIMRRLPGPDTAARAAEIDAAASRIAMTDDIIAWEFGH